MTVAVECGMALGTSSPLVMALAVSAGGCVSDAASTDVGGRDAAAREDTASAPDAWALPDVGPCEDAGHGLTLDACVCAVGEHCGMVLVPYDESWPGAGRHPGMACVADAVASQAEGDPCSSLSVSAPAHVWGACSVLQATTATAEASTCGQDLVCVMGVCRAPCVSDCPAGEECVLDGDWATSVCVPPMRDAGSPDAGSPDAGSPDAGNPDAGNPDAG